MMTTLAAWLIVSMTAVLLSDISARRKRRRRKH